CIKVDREERPDVDEIYMTALHVFVKSGGWPLSMFLTPDGKPVIGGTYWPPDDREVDGEKVKGFKSILKLMHELHRDKPKELADQAENVAEITRERLSQAARGVALVDLDRKLVTEAVDALKEGYDSVHGGFGNSTGDFRGPKFPMPGYLELTQREAARTKSAELAAVVEKTLDRMARGGMYDQLGGGFHRYSTERTWTVPHFEKMLYDNAQLLEVYARAHRAKPSPLYKRVLEETLAVVAREMTAPEGGFYSALDADSEGEEGRFYVWTAADLAAALPASAEAFRAAYGLDGAVNFESKYFILTLPKPLAEVAAVRKVGEDELRAQLEPVKKKLFEVRSKRERPFLDTKVLTAWNGQMIAGCAAAGKALGKPDAIAAAVKAAEFVLKTLRTSDGRLM